MNDTVTRLMNMARQLEEIAALCADPMNSDDELDEYRTDLYKARQALQDELTRLFKPLSDEQIENLWHSTFRYETNSIQTLFRLCENEHGITGDSKRCPLCNYQHGHQIGCKNNPVDIALQDGIGGES